jgi:hypothetical protein
MAFECALVFKLLVAPPALVTDWLSTVMCDNVVSVFLLEMSPRGGENLRKPAHFNSLIVKGALAQTS